MRRVRMGLLVVLILACVNGFAQNVTPQWKVVKAIQVKQGTAQLPITSLFTPRTVGPYRLTAYIACFSTTADPNAYWYLNLYWNDSTGFGQLTYASCSFNPGGEFGLIGPIPFTPQPGVPVQFQIQSPGDLPPVGSTYTFWFTIEHLE